MAKWIIDPDHSVAAFAVRHMMIADVRGQFNKVTGTILFDPADVAGSSVELNIDTASITTGIRKRDDHLKSQDFLDVERYPAITFLSTAVEVTGANRAKVAGDLTLHGVTHPVALEVEYFGPVNDPFGEGKSMGFSVAGTINRENYGIVWNEAMEGGGVIVGRDVRIVLDIEADLAHD